MKPTVEKIHWVCGSHWDREWHRPFEGFRCRLVDMMDRAIDCIENVPGYNYFLLDGQSIVLNDYLEARPDMREKVERLLREDKLFAGPFYVLQDEAIEDGELFVRNLQKGIEIAKHHGSTKFVGYSTDSFGHAAQLPQLLRLSGVDSLVFGRGYFGSQQDNIWASPDGSEVRFAWLPLANGPGAHKDCLEGLRHIPEDREEALTMFERFVERLEPFIRNRAMLVMDAADHLSADPAAVQLVEDFNKKHPDGPRLVISSLPEAVKDIFDSGDPHHIHGEMRMTGPAGDNWLLPGTLTSRMPLKHGLSDLTRRLLALEKLQTMLPFSQTWHDALDRAWDQLLQNIPHDSICGCHSDEVYLDNLSRLIKAKGIADYLCEKSLRAFAPALVRTGTHAAGIFFDPAPAAPQFKPFVLDCPYPYIEDPQRVRLEADGVTIAIEGVEDYPTFNAHLKTYRIKGFYRNATGAHVFSASIRTDDLRDPAPNVEALPLLQFVDSGDAGDTYNYSPPAEDRVVVGTGTPVRTATYRLFKNLIQTIVETELQVPASLADNRQSRSGREIPLRVNYQITKDTETGTTWINGVVRNNAADHRLRLIIPLENSETHSLAGAPFHIERRPVKLDVDPQSCRERPLTDYPFVDFIRYGNTSVFGQTNAEFQITPRGIEITLCRCVGWLGRPDLIYRKGQAGPRFETPLAQLLNVDIPFAFVIAASLGDLAADYARKVLLVPTMTQYMMTEKPLAVRQSQPVTVTGAELSALRRRDGEKIEIRLFNPRPEPVEVRLKGNMSDIHPVDLNHHKAGESLRLSGNTAILQMQGFEILTLLAWVAE